MKLECNYWKDHKKCLIQGEGGLKDKRSVPEKPRVNFFGLTICVTSKISQNHSEQCHTKCKHNANTYLLNVQLNFHNNCIHHPRSIYKLHSVK